MELEQYFSILKTKILKISEDYRNLERKYNDLEEKYKALEEKFDKEKEKNQKLVEDLKEAKLSAAISGNPDHNRLMKNHINRLIKEIDVCIAHLKNTGM